MEGCSYVGRQQEISKSFISMRPSSSHGVAWHGRPHLVTHEMCLTQEACRRAGGPGYNDQVGRDGKTNAVRQTCSDGKQGALMRRQHEPLLLSAPPQITWRGTLRSDICGLGWAQKGPSASSMRAPLTPLIALEGNNGRTTHNRRIAHFSSHTDQERSTFFFLLGASPYHSELFTKDNVQVLQPRNFIANPAAACAGHIRVAPRRIGT
jgi:hypothetical protein